MSQYGTIRSRLPTFLRHLRHTKHPTVPDILAHSLPSYVAAFDFGAPHTCTQPIRHKGSLGEMISSIAFTIITAITHHTHSEHTKPHPSKNKHQGLLSTTYQPPPVPTPTHHLPFHLTTASSPTETPNTQTNLYTAPAPAPRSSRVESELELDLRHAHNRHSHAYNQYQKIKKKRKRQKRKKTCFACSTDKKPKTARRNNIPSSSGEAHNRHDPLLYCEAILSGQRKSVSS